MRTIYVLNQEVGFELVAEFLFQSNLELSDVLSCTFPSRPEPKSACWKSKSGSKVIGYTYVPDIELRYLQLFDRSWTGFSGSSDAPILSWFAEKSTVPLFTDWNDLAQEIESENYRSVVRAASAFGVAAHVEDRSVDGESVLLQNMSNPSAVTRNVIAKELVDIASSKSESRLRELFDAETDSEIRFQLRQAIDRAMSRL